MIQKLKQLPLIECLVVIAIIAMILGAVLSVAYPERTPLYQSYSAWVKQTGNPNKLTFQEWEALTRVYRNGEIPMPQ